MFWKVEKSIEQNNIVDRIYTTKKNKHLVILNHNILGFESIRVELTQLDNEHWILQDNYFIAGELNTCLGRNIFQNKLVMEKLESMSNDINIDTSEKHIIAFASHPFSLEISQKESEKFLELLVDFVRFVERNKDEIIKQSNKKEHKRESLFY